MNANLTASYTDPTGWTRKHFDITSHDDIKTAANGVPESALFVIEIGRTELPANGRANSSAAWIGWKPQVRMFSRWPPKMRARFQPLSLTPARPAKRRIVRASEMLITPAVATTAQNNPWRMI